MPLDPREARHGRKQGREARSVRGACHGQGVHGGQARELEYGTLGVAVQALVQVDAGQVGGVGDEKRAQVRGEGVWEGDLGELVEEGALAVEEMEGELTHRRCEVEGFETRERGREEMEMGVVEGEVDFAKVRA